MISFSTKYVKNRPSVNRIINNNGINNVNTSGGVNKPTHKPAVIYNTFLRETKTSLNLLNTNNKNSVNKTPKINQLNRYMKDENVSANFIYPDSNTTNQSINKHINFGRNSINKTHNKINK
jgi:hypothetical protein